MDSSGVRIVKVSKLKTTEIKSPREEKSEVYTQELAKEIVEDSSSTSYAKKKQKRALLRKLATNRDYN